jgi:hypothetical protein
LLQELHCILHSHCHENLKSYKSTVTEAPYWTFLAALHDDDDDNDDCGAMGGLNDWQGKLK